MLHNKKTWKYKIRRPVIRDEIAEIHLSDGSVAIIDTIDIPKIEGWNWSAKPSRAGKVYAMRGAGKHKINLANAVVGIVGVIIDHINGDPLDNRRANLRIASYQQNTHNRRISKKNTSGFKGVSFRSDRSTWLAAITVNGHLKKIGTFSTPELAARAYDAAAKEAFGEYAYLNFPDKFGSAA